MNDNNLPDYIIKHERMIAQPVDGKKNKCFVYIKVDGDFANSISSKMTNVFSNMDFVVTHNAENSLYII